MNRSTWFTLAAFVVLLGAWFVQTRPRKVDAPPPLSVDGYIGNVSVEEARTLGQKQPPPYTHLELARGDGQGGVETIALDRQDADKPVAQDAKTPPPEAKWLAKRTVAGKAITWKAQGFRATTMAEQLQRSIRSTFAVKVDAKSAAEYGLDPAHALDVTLSGGGKPTVKLRIGLLQKAEKDGEATTWLADPAHPDVAYQVTNRDVRTAFDVSWNDLRDRQLLDLDWPAVTQLELERPGEPPEHIVVTRPALTADKGERAWTIAAPAGVRAGDVDEWLKALERLSAAEFVTVNDPAVKSSGLDQPLATLTITNNGQKTMLQFGATDASRPNKDTWLRIVGRDEVYRVGSYQHDQVVLDLRQLRDRHVFAGHRANSLQSFVISGPNGRVHAEQEGGVWRLIASKIDVDPAKIAGFVEALAALKVDFVNEVPAAALETPEWTIQLVFADGNQVLTLGKEELGVVYGKLHGTSSGGEGFKLAGGNAKLLQKQAADFAKQSPTSAAPTGGDAPVMPPQPSAPGAPGI